MTSQTEKSSKLSPAGNIVEGFSERFNFLLDQAKWPKLPKQHRITMGSQRFDVVPNTVKYWLEGNRVPATHTALVKITEKILEGMTRKYNPIAVAAWLMAGDAVPNPFGEDNTDALQVVNLYLQIAEAAKNEGIEFNSLPRDARNLIIKRVLAMNPSTDEDGVKFDNATLSMLKGMLEIAQLGRTE